MNGARAPLTLREVSLAAARHPGLTARELAGRLGAEPAWVELALAQLERLRLREEAARADRRPPGAATAARATAPPACRGCPLLAECGAQPDRCAYPEPAAAGSARAPRAALLARPPRPGAAAGAGRP